MNRLKKEERRRHAEARQGLTPEQVAELDRREAEAAKLAARAGNLHSRLFPEEYDFYYDSSVDAKLRAQGINPMSQEYIERTDARRRALGFAPYTDSPSGTRAWVQQMIHDGRGDELLSIVERYEAEEEEHRARNAPPTFADVPAEKVAAEVDAHLERWRVSHAGRTSDEESEVLGIYNFFLIKNADHEVFQGLVMRELRRLRPNEDEDVLRQRTIFAQIYWIEVYCG